MSESTLGLHFITEGPSVFPKAVRQCTLHSFSSGTGPRLEPGTYLAAVWDAKCLRKKLSHLFMIA
jgi:hypothetical protein